MATGVEELWQLLEREQAERYGERPEAGAPTFSDDVTANLPARQPTDAERVKYYESIGISPKVVKEIWGQTEREGREAPEGRGFFGDWLYSRRKEWTEPTADWEFFSPDIFPTRWERAEARRQMEIARAAMNNPIIESVPPPAFKDTRYESKEELLRDLRSQGYVWLDKNDGTWGDQWLVAARDPETGIWGNFIKFEVIPQYKGGYAVSGIQGAIAEGRLHASPTAEEVAVTESVRGWTWPQRMTRGKWEKMSAAERRRVMQIVESMGEKFEDWLKASLSSEQVFEPPVEESAPPPVRNIRVPYWSTRW